MAWEKKKQKAHSPSFPPSLHHLCLMASWASNVHCVWMSCKCTQVCWCCLYYQDFFFCFLVTNARLEAGKKACLIWFILVWALWQPLSRSAIISSQTGPTKPSQLDNEIHYELRAKRTARLNKDAQTHPRRVWCTCQCQRPCKPLNLCVLTCPATVSYISLLCARCVCCL